MVPSSFVVGSVDGHFEVFSKLSKLHSKTAFSLALILGDLFSDPAELSEKPEESLNSLLNGSIEVALPTYFTLGQRQLPQVVQERLQKTDGEVCPNLYFLGKRSMTKTSEGLRIVALGGSLDTARTIAASIDGFHSFHTEGDARALHGNNSADILITANWPTSVRKGSSIEIPEDAQEPVSEPCIAELCSTLKPRYHFSSSPSFFYEREPFLHPHSNASSGSSNITRFISMAAYRNSSQHKWLYAFSIDPLQRTTTTVPPGATALPFVQGSQKRHHLESQQQSFQRFSHREGGNHTLHGNKRRRTRPPPGPDSCFFCLSNPNLATHLITSIGNDSYLTTAKGPLTTWQTFPSLPNAGHVLIVPLSHSPTSNSITPPDTKLSTYSEMNAYRLALQDFIASVSEQALGTVCWEISRGENIHFHWQILPVPSHLIQEGLVEAAFKVAAENEKYPPLQSRDIGDASGEVGDYMRIWSWWSENSVQARSEEEGLQDQTGAKGHEATMILPLESGIRFDLQFPRKVVAKLLGLEDRIHWQDCAQDEAEEKRDADGFKKHFKAFDFTIDKA